MSQDLTERYVLQVRRGEFVDDLEIDIGVVTDDGIKYSTHKGDYANKLYLSLLRLNVVPPKKEYLTYK